MGNARLLVTPGASSPDSYGCTTGFGTELGTDASRANPFRFGGQYGYYRDDPFRLHVRVRHLSADEDTAGRARFAAAEPSSTLDATVFAVEPGQARKLDRRVRMEQCSLAVMARLSSTVTGPGR